jgi:cytochrome o ubiquinol oxidase operon protein cyoD
MISMESHTPKTTTRRSHGTTRSYVVGFILSLIFTIIPYYMVVNKWVAGNVLLASILGFAVIQMLIQIFFFLHLGRGPKPLYNVVFFFATAGLIVLVIAASLLIMSNLYRNMSPEEVILKQSQEEGISQIGGRETGACTELKDSHIVTISEGVASPSYTEAQACDTLTFINEDDKERLIGFGSHPDHDGYGGADELLLKTGRPETITLNQTGDFTFHDHLEPTIGGHFTVLERNKQ